MYADEVYWPMVGFFNEVLSAGEADRKPTCPPERRD